MLILHHANHADCTEPRGLLAGYTVSTSNTASCNLYERVYILFNNHTSVVLSFPNWDLEDDEFSTLTVTLRMRSSWSDKRWEDLVHVDIDIALGGGKRDGRVNQLREHILQTVVAEKAISRRLADGGKIYKEIEQYTHTFRM